MKVSIITPCYNAEQLIETTILSIQKQTLTDWEFILVDDGSTDTTAEIIRSYALLDKRIKLIQKENGGTASARKMGLEHATGEYIQFLDADDQLDEDKLLRQTTIMDKQQLHISYTDWCFAQPNGEKEPIQGMNCSLTRILLFWGTFGTLPIHSFMYRQDFLKKNNITFNTDIREREDWDFHIQVFSANPKAERISGYCGAIYMKNPTGKTSNGNLEKIRKGTLRFLDYQIRHVKGFRKLCLLLRLSVELCFLLLSTFKYRLWSQLQLLSIFKQSWASIIELLIAILLVPISLCIIIAYIIYTRCR